MRQKSLIDKEYSMSSVRGTFYHIVTCTERAHTGIFENVLGFNAELSTEFVSKTKILPWVLKRIESPKHDENRGYAAEILSILLQINRTNRLELGKKDGVESILKILSVGPANFALILELT